MSPLELFRRNQKVMMTGLVLLAMFAFVILPTITQYMARSGPGMVDPVMAKFNGISLTSSRVNAFTRKHYETVQFLRRLADETIRRGGTPQVPGYSVDPRTQMVDGVGINPTPSDDMSIRTLQFAAEAQEDGFELDDLAIEFWLERFTDGTMSEREILALLRKQTNNQMGQYQLYDMLRKQLLSGLFFRGAGSTVARGQFPLQTPLDHWNNFLRLNQNAVVNAYGVMVNDFVKDTNENPSESEIVAVYEAGKDRFPSEQSPEPGFRRRDTATVEYVVAELQAFRDALVAELPEETIRAAYDKEIAGGAFQLPPDMNLTPDEGDDSASPETDDQPTAGGKTEAEASEGDSESREMKSEQDTAQDDSAKETAERNAAQVQEFEKELQEAGNLNGADSDGATESESEPAAESDTTEESDDKQSSIGVDDNGVRLVLAQSDVSTEDSETAAEDQAPSSDTPADNENGDSEPASDPEESEAKSNEQNDAKAEDSEVTDSSEATTPEPRYRPYDEVRDQVAQSLIEQDARVALDQAVTKVRTEMRKYSRQLSLFESSGSKEAAPTPPDLATLAKELGLTHRVIGPHDPITMDDEPIARSFEEGTALSQRGVPFSAMIFGVEGQVVKQETYSPVVSVDLENQRTYVAWKTEEKEAYTPELKEIRDEVVDAVRFAQARKLAEQAAKSIADEANEAGSISDLIPEDRKDNYIQDVGPFTWLVQVGFGGVTIGNVPQLDSVNEDFMKAVFTAKEGEHVVASNGPQRVYYVVKRTSVQPAIADLRSIFKQPSQRMMSTFISDGTASKVQQGYFDTADEKAGFVRYDLSQE